MKVDLRAIRKEVNKRQREITNDVNKKMGLISLSALNYAREITFLGLGTAQSSWRFDTVDISKSALNYKLSNELPYMKRLDTDKLYHVPTAARGKLSFSNYDRGKGMTTRLHKYRRGYYYAKKDGVGQYYKGDLTKMIKKHIMDLVEKHILRGK